MDQFLTGLLRNNSVIPIGIARRMTTLVHDTMPWGMTIMTFSRIRDSPVLIPTSNRDFDRDGP